MARAHGYYGMNKVVLWNNVLAICGILSVSDLMGYTDDVGIGSIPNILSFSIMFLLIVWSIQIANIYATQDLECIFSESA